jgi:hypothetical protein
LKFNSIEGIQQMMVSSNSYTGLVFASQIDSQPQDISRERTVLVMQKREETPAELKSTVQASSQLTALSVNKGKNSNIMKRFESF